MPMIQTGLNLKQCQTMSEFMINLVAMVQCYLVFNFCPNVLPVAQYNQTKYCY